MRNLPNIDKSSRRKGEYIGYTQRQGLVRIRKVGKQWCAHVTVAGWTTLLHTRTLAEMSALLNKF